MMGPCYLLALLTIISAVSGKVRYNSQYSPPNNIRFADIANDGVDEFLLNYNDTVYLTTTEFAVHGITYLKLPGPAINIIHGRFTGGPKQEICARLYTLNVLDCYGFSPRTQQFEHMSAQSDFIMYQGTVQRNVAVGDFNGDGRDDVLLWASAGIFEVWTWNPSNSLFQQLNWQAGDLSFVSMNNVLLSTGDFDGDGRTDVMLYTPTYAQLMMFLTVYDAPSAKYTMSKNISTGDCGGPQWECMVANVDGDATDDAVLHNTVTGQFLSYSTLLSSNHLPVALNVDMSQIQQGPNPHVYFGKFKIAPSSEDGGRSNLRDDAMVYSNSTVWIRSDARHDGVRQTYMLVYTQLPLNLSKDQDGDAIITAHELGGYDPDHNGASDGILVSYGASPFVKDIFVHVDYMAGPSGATWNYSMTSTSISLAVSTMASKNINLHIFIGSQTVWKANLGNPSFDWVNDFDPIKNAYFPATRVPFFHYCLMAAKYDGGTSSGQSRAIIAQDFIVTVPAPPTVAQQVGTFLHELGHNLGLRHGSTDDVNYKPNHLSIMNYAYQFTGITKNGTNQFLYSDIACVNLKENALNESTGVQCATNSIKYLSYIRSSNTWIFVNAAYDWNSNSVFDTNVVSQDVNVDQSLGTLTGGVNEFDILVFHGSPIGSAAKRSDEKAKSEPATIYEPPMEQLPTTPFTFSTDFSAYKLKPHNGSQYLDVPYRYPVHLYKSADEAFILHRPNEKHDVRMVVTRGLSAHQRGPRRAP